MNKIIEFLTTKELILVYTVVIAAAVICSIIYFIDKLRIKRKLKNNTKELTELAKEINIELQDKQSSVIQEEKIEEVTEELTIEPIKVETLATENTKPVFAPVEKTEEIPAIDVLEELIIEPIQEVKKESSKIIEEPIKEEDLIYAPIEPNQTEAQAELKKLTEVLMKAEEEEKNIGITNFETEQEENAIISLDELMNRTKMLYENNQLETMDDEGDEPISLADLEKRKKALFEQPQVVQEVIEVEEPKIEVLSQPVQQILNLDNKTETEIINKANDLKKFVSSPIISPIYGIEAKETLSASMMELENTANYDKLDEEIKKTNEFLMTLKELQKNLD